MRKFVITSLLEDSPAVFRQSDWRPHVTIVRPFTTDLPIAQLAERIDHICAQFPKIPITGKSKEFLGPQKEIPVTELESSPILQRLHEEVMQEFGPFVIPESHVLSFRPHVTDLHSGMFGVGEEAIIGSVSIVEMVDDERRILHTSPLH
ncbi:MAG: hypothetical protein QOE22_160 [Candidatus Parcubacteria bacterium]|jgi:2'-5' RNA ligase|nr:hypothetical protein [Candidatus Parcubacteria bacterium]